MMRICRLIGFLLFLIMLSFAVYAEASDDAVKESSEENSAEAEDEKSEKEKIQIESLNEQKRDVLNYGIDSEVLDIISTIRSENDRSFDDELAELLANNDNIEINRAIFDFFGLSESKAGVEKALKLVKEHLDDYELSTNLILSAISYLGIVKEKEASDLFYEMINDNNKSLAGAALRGIGKLVDDSRADEIMTFFEDNEGDSDYEDLLASAILVLGELGYKDASIVFEDVLLDEDAPKVHRQYAAISIGKLQSDSGFDLLKEQFVLLEDANLRSYVLKGLTDYDKSELDSLLISALRDSFWRIRMAASEGLGSREVGDAVDILIYKVKKDPVRQVRYSSMKALADIATSEANDFILEQFKSPRNAFDLRAKALDVMLDKQINGTIDVLKEILDKKWEDEKDNELGPFCKTLSTTEWAALEPFYNAMIQNENYIIQIYGIRGIKINKLSSLKSRLQELDTEDQHVNVRREVKAALDSL
ncbi:MAG: hypothetical protein B6241_03035 [Spirochaetaceae bacterium 4572_59]|nr:MAG: hypothetical protein B6241_03035 [Spirochaetaceae bacterium 4572_59]